MPHNSSTWNNFGSKWENFVKNSNNCIR